MKNRGLLVLFLWLSLLLTILFFFMIKTVTNYNVQEYKKVTKMDSVYSSVEPIMLWKGATKTELSNGEKVRFGFSENGIYYYSFLGDFIKQGDSISKKAGSDSLFITRNSKSYFFIMDSSINIKNGRFSRSINRKGIKAE